MLTPSISGGYMGVYFPDASNRAPLVRALLSPSIAPPGAASENERNYILLQKLITLLQRTLTALEVHMKSRVVPRRRILKIRGLIWGVVKNLLKRLVTKTSFELTFANNPESGRVESRAGLAKMMKSVTPHGARDILEKLDNILLTELRELLVLPTKEVPDRKKLKVIVILHEDPRSLENSVEFAVKSLSDANFPDDRIGIRFVQVGFSRRLFDALKDVVENDYTNLADFTTYTGPGPMVDQSLGRIRLGSVDPTFSRPPETP
ncbi:hypothetical protein B0H11DRAFT_1916517 [Mycena galericulata]|nr:hypothetical protein B0H11DRAFT_1916517 [Mycena galericulata]